MFVRSRQLTTAPLQRQTKNMPEEEVEQWFDRVYRLAEQRDFDALREFEFISVGKLRRSKESVLTSFGR
jgi:hypothetical protein